MTASRSFINDLSSTRWMNVAYVLFGVLLATLIRFPIQPIIHGSSPFLFYIPVVVAMAVMFGFRCGLFATLLSVVPANYYWMGVEGAFEMDMGEFCQILGFSVAGISVSWLSSSARKRKQLEEHLRSTLASISDAIVTADCHGKVVYLNAAAQLLTETQAQDVSGNVVSGVLNLVTEEGGYPLNGMFHLAVVNDDIEELPRRLILLSRSGRQHRVEQKTSRILDASGKKIGMSFLFRCLNSGIVTFPSADPAKVDVLNAKSRLPRIAMVIANGCPKSHASWISSGTSGHAVYVRELSKKVAECGYEVDVWTKSLANHFDIEFVTQRVRVIRIAGSRETTAVPGQLTGRSCGWCEAALETIKQYSLKYEILCSHCWDGAAAGRLLSRELGIAHFHMPHFFSAATAEQAKAAFLQTSGRFAGQTGFSKGTNENRSAAAPADVIVATSPRQRDELARYYSVPKGKQWVVRCGYDDGRFFPASDMMRKSIRQRMGFAGPVIQTAFRLADEKNLELLMEAFADVSRQMPEVIFHFVIGSNALTGEEAQAFIRLRARVTHHGLSKKVSFKSFVSDCQMADYYRAADVFVHYSQNEFFSMTAVEAMACGAVMVLATRSSWEDSLKFGQDALYADASNPKGLAGAITSILRQPLLRAQISLAGAKTAYMSFSWTAIAQQFATAVEYETGYHAR